MSVEDKLSPVCHLENTSTSRSTTDGELWNVHLDTTGNDPTYIVFIRSFVGACFVLFLIRQIDRGFFEVVLTALEDAYLGVSVFVAATLAVFYGARRLLNTNFIASRRHNQTFQIIAAAFLGALPGCGGALIVVTQFVQGKMTFGALVTVLVSTMGDAAFLLIAHEPKTALLVLLLSISAGIVFGMIVNLIHGKDFLRINRTQVIESNNALPALPPIAGKLFLLIAMPGLLVGLLAAFQIGTADLFPNSLLSNFDTWIGVLGSIVCFSTWFSRPNNSWTATFHSSNDSRQLHETVTIETRFVTVFVILGFVLYETVIYYTDLDLGLYFLQLGVMVPLLAILIGFIPGCGPQILITTLYINGIVPLSAQIANAISNDGDALFPAIALAPRASVIATIYSAIPALVMGYGAYSLGW